MAVAELVAQPPVEQSLFLADFTDYLLPNPEYFDEGQAYIDSDNNRVEMIGQQILKSGIDISFLADMEPTSLNLGRALYLLTIFRINEMLEINEKQREEIRMLYSYYMPRKRWNIVM